MAAARARARGANRARREGRGGGRAVGTTDGDDGRGGGRRRELGTTTGAAGAGGAAAAAGLAVYRRKDGGPASKFWEARRRCPSWIRCGSGWASTTRRWVRAPVGAEEATRRGPGAAAGLAGLGPPLPRAPRGTTKAGAGPATPPPRTLGARARLRGAPRGAAPGSPGIRGESPCPRL